MLSTFAPCSLSPQLVRISLLPDTSVSPAVDPATGQTLGSLGDDLDVGRVSDVMQPVPTDNSGHQPSPVVLLFCNDLKMLGVYTSTGSAEVINLETGGYGTSVVHPEATVSNVCFVQLSAKNPIAVMGHWSLPDPATCFVHEVAGPVVDEGFGHVPESRGGDM